ncbi:MAG TPA: hypothetical protein VOA78_15665 [Candidatus Dormibacteraeota bacterium]|nr:hypothetical protein [Candidatus Dormibacteraeota bacterium]
MSSLRTAFAVFLSLACGAGLLGRNDLSRFFTIHPVWVQKDLSWEQDPGDKQQKFANGSSLYFGSKGDFGSFRGTLVKQGARLGLAEGEGEIVYAGTWKVTDATTLAVDYRLVGAYKLVRPKGEDPLEIPGPIRHAEIHLGPKPLTSIEFDGTKFEATSAIKTSELKEHLQLYAPADNGKHAGPK